MGSKPLRLLVVGRHGQLARSIAKITPDYPQLQIDFSDRAELDLLDTGTIQHYFDHRHYDTMLNTAAYTAVDRAEGEAEQAEQINHLAVEALAEIAKQQQSRLIHVSTDYVFDGAQNTPYLEGDALHPTSVYGSTKLKGEQALQAFAPDGAIVRTSWLYSEFGHNYVKTMLRLGEERDQLDVVYDQVGSPTYATDLAHALLTIAATASNHRSSAAVPVYHFANQGVCSWYDFASAIFELAEVDCVASPITSEQYPTPVKRPHYSVLSTEKIKRQFQLSIPYWRDALKRCLRELESNEGSDV